MATQSTQDSGTDRPSAGDRYKPLPRPSPVGGSGFVIGGVVGAAIYGPVGAVIGGVIGLLAGEAIEHRFPSIPDRRSDQR